MWMGICKMQKRMYVCGEEARKARSFDDVESKVDRRLFVDEAGTFEKFSLVVPLFLPIR
jgi:hypothetical protein